MDSRNKLLLTIWTNIWLSCQRKCTLIPQEDVNVPHRMKCTHGANLNSLKERSRHDSCKFVKAKVWLPVSPGTNTFYTLCNFVFNFMSKCWWWCLLWVSKSGWRKNLLKHFLHLEPHTNVIIALIRWNFTVIVPLWGKL